MNSSSRRRQILEFIHAHLATGAPFPSWDEIAGACELKSHSAVQKHVKALEMSGELEGVPVTVHSRRPKQRKLSASGHVPLFEISVHDVIALNDGDLRELVARLCIAALAEVNLPPTPVKWGGDQRAPDGGIDVRVELSAGDEAGSWFVRAITGFQVKATRMGLGEIQQEMCKRPPTTVCT